MPDTELEKLAKRIKPLIRLRKTKYYDAAQYHLFNKANGKLEVWAKAEEEFEKNDLLVWTNPVCLKESFYYALEDDFVVEEDLGIPLPVLEPKKVAEFTCYLKYSGYYGILRPCAEDVLQQFPQNLIAKGIIFDGSSYDYPVSYIFTKLNEIKPQMLEEATKNAKEAAFEFAKSSGSKVGKIRHANQGVFSILPREQISGSFESQQIEKTVRVVSTIEYWLE